MTTASQPRSGSASSATSAAACGRRAHTSVRLWPVPKNSATICPCPATSAPGLVPLPGPPCHRSW